jgi:hypothetical protein
MWYVPHHSFFYWLCACTLYLSVIVNLANLNTFFGHNLLILYLHYCRSWNKYDKHSQSKMNIWKSFNVIIHESTFHITIFLFMCAWVMTQGLEHNLWVPISSGLDIGVCFMNFNVYIQCMWHSLKLLICLENSNSNVINFNFYTRNKRIYGTKNSFKTSINKEWCVQLWNLVD